ncbi:hypothetical protein SAMN05216203_0754 [Marinobacter daqiaonensis]|uniref:Phosphodiesterase n=1 Tax=Marinobacter daqiaonensis TaxID=650891 RepID=A0A1I6H1Y9_9GAMM|nr:hypothetical protein [Marinobacter daqiaonensis]SFR48438.1 hypothetical protein SAMN05216203_0754 [Marinobacter daqiaonensis]
MKKLTSAAIAASLAISAFGLATVPGATAEEVKVPVMSQGERKSMDLPDTGQTRETVRQRYGDPVSTSGPVGDPPITQWHYPGFVVYFEYNRVIHTVVKPAR